MTVQGVDRLYLTGDDDADRLLASDPNGAPHRIRARPAGPGAEGVLRSEVLRDRLGSIDPAHLAGVDEVALQAAAKGPPAIHRFPSAMAKRVRELATYVRDTYQGDASRLWTDASDAHDLKKRIAALPGFGDMKVASLYAVLVRQLGIDIPGAQDELPGHPTLGDVNSAEALANYQATKRAHKAELRARGGCSGSAVRSGPFPIRGLGD